MISDWLANWKYLFLGEFFIKNSSLRVQIETIFKDVTKDRIIRNVLQNTKASPVKIACSEKLPG